MDAAARMEKRLDRLEEHLKRENPVLVEVVQKYRELDEAAHKLRLLDPGQSYATQISWWPLVSVLGTFSAGKSSFINSYLGVDLQRSGNQAVDDNFTVITFSPDGKQRTLPGLALDGDPRFPFYQISEDIERVTKGEGARIDNYLQMKVVGSEKVRGKILIDSPGFDADEQRNTTLKITDHIIELSDLVLVFFDARHPEPGAMQDTLEHLVKAPMRRNDSSKFLFILNQIDTSARDDNLEEIVASWQKALVQQGLSSGSFHTIYNEKLAQPVDDEAVWRRYVNKRDTDYQRIMQRISTVNVERVYRIIGNLEALSNGISQQVVPSVKTRLKRWSKSVIIADVIGVIVIVVACFMLYRILGWQLPNLFDIAGIIAKPWILIPILLPVGLWLTWHYFWRIVLANHFKKGLVTEDRLGNLQRVFMNSTKWWRSAWFPSVGGYGRWLKRRLTNIRDASDHFVQSLNDRFTDPSGRR